MIPFEPLKLILCIHHSFHKRGMTCVKDKWGLYTFISQIHVDDKSYVLINIAFLNVRHLLVWPESDNTTVFRLEPGIDFVPLHLEFVLVL